MKKAIYTILIFAMCICILSGCQCKHEWTEASCTAAKTCTKCDATEGEPLAAGFETLGINGRFTELGVSNTITVDGTQYTHTIVSHKINAENESYEALDGYVWHTVKVKVKLQENQPSPGNQLKVCADFADYYTPTEQTASAAVAESDALFSISFSTNYKGKEYPDCLCRIEESIVTEVEDETWY